MVASNINVTHAANGVVVAEVTRAEQISPHFFRVTVAGDDLANWRDLGFDQWFRMALPVSDNTRLDNLADTFDMRGYLKYLTLPRATRPVIRSYTVRQFRASGRELDIDLVVHGDDGVAGPWARSLPVGARVGLIDQGCGFRNVQSDNVLLVGDESALPAVAGILRDLPATQLGTALIEVPHIDDRQDLAKPEGVELHWVVRSAGEAAGEPLLAQVRALQRPDGSVNAFAAGESRLATGTRRHLIGEWGLTKQDVTFCGYWRAGHARG